MNIETLPIASATDKLMHAAQYRAGVGKGNYSDPAVWDSREAAVVILRDRYAYLHDMLEYLWTESFRQDDRRG